MDTHTRYNFPLAITLLAAFWPTAQATDEDEVTKLIKPESTVSLGVGYVDRDNQRFGQYNGLNQRGAYGLLDVDAVQRDDATGTWLKFSARSLGLDDRELRFEQQRQGDWGYFIDYSQIPRFNPLTVNTGLTGIGSANLTINGGPARDVQLETERKRVTLGLDKVLPSGFDFQVRFRNEEKNGARLFGQGNGFAPVETRFLTDPIDYTTRQWEAIAGYTTERLQLSAGYYGSSFNNHITALNIVGGIAALGSPLALPPGNQSHQLYVTGGYNLTPTTRASFKLAYTRQTQDETFVAPAANGRTNLDGRVDTTLAQVGLTARPLPKLSLLANFRYEDRNDKTPSALYFTGVTPASTLDGFNEPRSIKTTSGKVEASYQLPMGFRLTGGADYEEKERNVFRVRSVSARDRTDEIAGRVEVRRSIGETLTGAIAYVHSERDGSPFLTTVVNGGAVGSNLIAPFHLADRTRDKVRATVNWMPLDPLSLQFVVEDAWDRYDSRTSQDLGLRTGKAQNYSADAAYTFSEKWQATAWASRNNTRAEQASQQGTTLWAANLRNVSDAFGLGVRGKPTARLEVGVDVQHSDITDEYRQLTLSGPFVATSLPDVSSKLTSLKLFAKYAVRKNMGVRFDYIHDRFKTNDWTWTNWVYSDGTTVIQNPNQIVNFFGMSVYFTWQ